MSDISNRQGTDNIINIGTRGSRLAIRQAELVAGALRRRFPDTVFQLVTMSTRGDREKNRALPEFGGKAVFVEEFEEAIADGRIDMAVHSAKDMPMELMGGLVIGGVLPRACPQDVMIYRADRMYEKASGIVIGTSSLRRQYQIKELYKSAVCRPLRGNVGTRLDKLRNGEYDAIILAAAGIERLGLDSCDDLTYEYLPLDDMTPAACQGIIAIETKAEGIPHDMALAVSDETSYRQLICEREVLKLVGAGCHEPIGVYSEIEEDDVKLTLYRGAEEQSGSSGDTEFTRRTARGSWQELGDIIHSLTR